MSSLRAPLLGIYSLAPDSVPLLAQWALCTYIYYCCGTSPSIFGNYTQSHSGYPSRCRFTDEKRNWIEERCSETGDLGRGLQELDCGADKFHIEQVNMFLSCYPACTLTRGVCGGGFKRINQILIILFGFFHSLLFVSISVSHRAKDPSPRARTMEGVRSTSYFPTPAERYRNECTVIMCPNVWCLKSGFLQQS